MDSIHPPHTRTVLRSEPATQHHDNVLGPDPAYEAFGCTNMPSHVVGNGTSIIRSCDDGSIVFIGSQGEQSFIGLTSGLTIRFNGAQRC